MDVVVYGFSRLVGQAIAAVLSEVFGLAPQGVCTSADEVCQLIRKAPPRLLVLDVAAGEAVCLPLVALLRQLRPEAELLILTSSDQPFVIPDAWAPITVGVVDKAQGWDQLLFVLQRWWSQQRDEPRQPCCAEQLAAIDRLSPRERRLLQELGCGLSNKEIASRLQLSVATVESYRKGVAAKLAISGAELVRLATLHRTFGWTLGSPQS